MAPLLTRKHQYGCSTDLFAQYAAPFVPAQLSTVPFHGLHGRLKLVYSGPFSTQQAVDFWLNIFVHGEVRGILEMWQLCLEFISLTSQNAQCFLQRDWPKNDPATHCPHHSLADSSSTSPHSAPYPELEVVLSLAQHPHFY